MKYDRRIFKTPEIYIEHLQVISHPMTSLNVMIGEDEETELGEMIEHSMPSPEDIIMQREDKAQLLMIIQKILTPREQVVIMARFGLKDGFPMTLAEVGKEFGVTRERIRQIEFEALRRIREYMKTKNIKNSDFRR